MSDRVEIIQVRNGFIVHDSDRRVIDHDAEVAKTFEEASKLVLRRFEMQNLGGFRERMEYGN